MKSSIKYYSLLSLFGTSLLPIGLLADDETASPDADTEDSSAAAKVIDYSTPAATARFFQETFDNGLPDSFVHTSGTKQDEDNNKYNGLFLAKAMNKDALAGDLGLVAPEKAKHYGIAAPLKTAFNFDQEDDLVVSYEVNFQTGIDCGGAYIKLLAGDQDLDLESFHDKTRFSLMFGPDKCANDFKLHLILNHKNPVTGEFEEKHLKEMPTSTILKPYYTDSKAHVYKLHMKNDSTFKISIDGKEVSSGSLLNDMKPEINPPKEIEDPEAVKPEDWDEREKIADPEASKPEDWDESEPKQIVDENAKMPSDWREDIEPTMDDPEAVMPEDWDEDMDGEYEAPQVDNPLCKGISGCGVWEAPMIDNPKYKGKWRAPMIKNPDYQGKWAPEMIANPGYFEDSNPFATTSPISALAVEIWTMNDDIYFDNFVVSDSEIEVDSFVAATHGLKVKQAKANEPSFLEKAKKSAEGNAKIVIGSVLGLGVLTIMIYFAFFKKSKTSDKKVGFADKNEEKTITESEDEQDKFSKHSEAEEEQGQGDHSKEADTPASETQLADTKEEEADASEESNTSEKSASGSDSGSDEEEPVVAKGPRKRNVRRAD